MFPVVEKVLSVLGDCESMCVASSVFLIEDTKKTTIEILSYIASGYNNYETTLKATEYNKARKAKPYTNEILQFSMDLEKNLLSLQEELLTNTYIQSKYREFIVFDPKERKIKYCRF